MAYEAKQGEVCLFENEKAGHKRAPDHRGYLVAHRDIKAGDKIAIALWAGNPDSARSFRGVVSDFPEVSVVEVERDLFGKALVEKPKASR